MNFEKNKLAEKTGIKTGFIFSYFLFTTILFLVLDFLNKLNSMTIFHVAGITLLITLAGMSLKKWLY